MKIDDILSWPDKRPSMQTDEGRYLVLRGLDGVHRLRLVAGTSGQVAAATLLLDHHMPLRLCGISRLHNLLTGSKTKLRRCDVPTPYQAARLSRMLRILDLADEARLGRISSRQVAREILFPSTSFASAVEWKISSERRHTLRVIAEAELLRDGGYRDLLIKHSSSSK